jgi:hypothetical protein
VSGKIVATVVERALVDRRGDDAFDGSGADEGDGALDGESSEPARIGCASIGGPFADGLVNVCGRAARSDDQRLTAVANPRIRQRTGDDLGADPSRVTDGDREPGKPAIG